MPDIRLEFRGEITLPQDLTVDGHAFGGISGLTRDAESGLYFGVGDDLENARFHAIRIDVSDGRLDDGDVEVLSSVLFNDIDQRPFPGGALDPEEIVLLPDGTLLIAAETVGDRFPAFIRRYTRGGHHLDALHVDPLRYDPRFDEARGSRTSGGLESLTHSADSRTQYAGWEKPLKQNMAEAAYDQRSPAPVRIMEIDRATGRTVAEYVYMTGTMTIAPDPADGWYGRGLNDLLWLDDGLFLSVERQYAQGTTAGEGSRPVQIFAVGLEGATNVLDRDALDGSETPVTKELVLDLETLRTEHGLARIGSHEVLLLGPALPDGSESLIMIEDNDFDRPTQVLLFALRR